MASRQRLTKKLLYFVRLKRNTLLAAQATECQQVDAILAGSLTPFDAARNDLGATFGEHEGLAAALEAADRGHQRLFATA